MKIATLYAEFRQTGLAKLSAGMTGLHGRMKKMNIGLTKFSAVAKKAFMVTGGLLALAAREAIKFQSEMAMVATMLDSKMLPIMEKYEKGIQRMSVEFGQSTATMAKGLYDILSASIAPAEALNVLRVAAKAATGGLTTTAIAADALTTILNSYQMSADQATVVSDKLFMTVKRGKLTFAELASSIGKAAATAAIAGVGLEELLASISTITRAGIRSDQAMVAVVGTIRAFLKPSEDGAKAARALGFELNTATLKAEGLHGVFQKLKGLDAGELATIFPNIRGLKGVAAAMQDLEGFGYDIEQMYRSGGKAAEAAAIAMNTVEFQLGQVRKGFAALFEEVGRKMLPAIKEFADWLIKLTRGLRQNSEKIKEWLVFIAQWSLIVIGVIAGIKLLTGAIGGLIAIIKLWTIVSALSPWGVALSIIAGIAGIVAALLGWFAATSALTDATKLLTEAEESAEEAVVRVSSAHKDAADILMNKIKLLDILARKEHKSVEDQMEMLDLIKAITAAYPKLKTEIEELAKGKGFLLPGIITKATDESDLAEIAEIEKERTAPRDRAEAEYQASQKRVDEIREQLRQADEELNKLGASDHAARSRMRRFKINPLKAELAAEEKKAGSAWTERFAREQGKVPAFAGADQELAEKAVKDQAELDKEAADKKEEIVERMATRNALREKKQMDDLADSENALGKKMFKDMDDAQTEKWDRERTAAERQASIQDDLNEELWLKEQIRIKEKEEAEIRSMEKLEANENAIGERMIEANKKQASERISGMQSLLSGMVGGLSPEDQRKFQADVFRQQITKQLGPDLAKEHAATIDKITANMTAGGGPSGGRFQSFTDLRRQIQSAALSPEMKLGKMQLEETIKIRKALEARKELAIVGN